MLLILPLSVAVILYAVPPAPCRGQCFTSEDDEAEAPFGVPKCAASQQHLVVVQRVRLPVHSQRALELVQAVVGWLTAHLPCGEHTFQIKSPPKK